MDLLKRLTGFKTSRFRDWMRVVQQAHTRIPWHLLAIEIANGCRGTGRVTRSDWRRRIRACQACPIYDPVKKTCRPVSGGPLGCGCYMPFKAALVRRGACWARQNLPNAGIGFE